MALAPSAELSNSLRLLIQDRISFIIEASLTDTDAVGLSPERNRRILAVVSHRDEQDRHEEGSVFILKHKTGNSDPAVIIEKIFPIFGPFSISMAQVRRESISSLVDQPMAALKITLTSGLTLEGHEPFSLLTEDAQGLRNVLKECKRLKDISDNANTEDLNDTYSWLAAYASGESLLPILSSTPTDLRHLSLQDRLSQAQPGISDNDTEDLLLIRDDWIRHKVRETVTHGKRKLSLRIGTFNVNGRLPSQDLSPWVRGMGRKFDSPPPPPVYLPPSRSPLDDFHASLILSEKLDMEEQSVADTTSAFSVDSHSSMRAIPPTASSLSTYPSSSSFTLPGDAHSFKSKLSSASLFSNPQVDLLSVPLDPDNTEEPDLLVLGFQELDLSAEALIYSTSTVKEDAWSLSIFAALGERASHYEKIASKQLVGMLLIVIVKKTLRPCFKEIQTCAVGSGIMGVMGNKGGTAVRLTFVPPPDANVSGPGPTVLTFVNSHLAAFDEMVDRRNADFHDLSKRLLFDPVHPMATPISTQQALNVDKINVYESDALFWMGDLNYRINLPDQDVRGLVASPHWDNKFEVLQKYDQLKGAMASNKAFEIFTEPPISHVPTYRFSSGLRDELGYDLKRKPAWTDRILHLYSPSTVHVQQLNYSGHPEITMSDHRPVSADFTVDIDVYDKPRCEEVARTLYRKVEGMHHGLERSSIKLDVSSIDFGQLFYKRATSRKVSLRNNGKVACAYRFVPLHGTESIHPDWLHVEPMTGLLLPGQVVDLTIVAYVDKQAARLNLGPRSLECTLILHLIMGQDHFIAVTAEFEHTCFANSVERLTRLPGPIRSLKSHDDLLAADRSVNAPREIMRLVNWLMNSNQQDGIFTSHGEPSLVGVVRECLDTGSEYPFRDSEDPKIPLVFGDTLIQLLDSLVEPIVPVALHPRCVQATSRDEAFEILEDFPPPAVNVWISVTAYLHFLIQSSSEPDAKAEKLAAIFAPVLLRDDDTATPVSWLGKQSFILFFIN
ncbi:DNase I-like protein [Mycena floridula]|nr:DNase I-like protein [Mycena floridula]